MHPFGEAAPLVIPLTPALSRRERQQSAHLAHVPFAAIRAAPTAA
jgi:hypothetical protein